VPETPEPDANHVAAQEAELVMRSLEADQLASAKAERYPRRQLKRSQVILFWGLRVYLLFMIGVVCYQVWTATR
jgi:hypothetical protein